MKSVSSLPGTDLRPYFYNLWSQNYKFDDNKKIHLINSLFYLMQFLTASIGPFGSIRYIKLDLEQFLSINL